MRKRWQRGSVRKMGSSWVGQYRDEEGRGRSRVLGQVSEMTKTEARESLGEILAAINAKQGSPQKCTFGDFIHGVYLPFYRRKWKSSTSATNEDRLRRCIVSEFTGRPLSSFRRAELQDYLDRMAARGLSFSTVDHLRWDLRQIFDMAVAEGYLSKNPAALLFTPKEAARGGPKKVMSPADVQLLLSALGLREMILARLVLIEGIRPGEALALKWGDIQADRLNVQRRVYRGKIDSPKTVRRAEVAPALSDATHALLEQWRATAPDASSDGWVFPSETLRTPIAKDNLWRRHFSPFLKAVGLGWVTFQIMRRSGRSAQQEMGTDPKVAADQLGHTLDVSLNVYTQTSVVARKQAVDGLNGFLTTPPNVVKVS
jgi:integrase